MVLHFRKLLLTLLFSLLKNCKFLQFYYFVSISVFYTHTKCTFLMSSLLVSLLQVLSFADRDQEDRIDPMVYIFPRYLLFHTAHYTLHTAYCTIHTAHYKLHTKQYTLHTVHYTLHAVHSVYLTH